MNGRQSPNYACGVTVLKNIALPSLFLVLSNVAAQQPIESIERPGERYTPRPELEEPAPAPRMILPPLQPPTEDDRVSAGLRIYVKEFHFEGNTVFFHEELKKISAPYENRIITSAELQEVRQLVTRSYVEKGYINSGAIIPDQKVVDGIITLKIIEGVLTTIELAGNDRLRDSYILDRVKLGAGSPLDIDGLRQRLQLLQQSPLIDRVNAELAPGLRRGEGVLNMRVEEARQPYQISGSYDNHRSPAVGAERMQLAGYHRNLFGFGDMLSGDIGDTDGLEDYFISYSIPLNAYDTRFTLKYDKSRSEVIEAPFDVLDIKSLSNTIGIGLRHPLYQTTTEELALELGLERRRSETYLLGLPFSFSPGAQDGESHVSVLRFSQHWLRRNPRQVLSASSRFSFGLNIMNATVNDGLPDSKFVSWLGQFLWARRLGERGVQVSFRTDLQLTSDNLLPLEQFAVGGAHSVRGYRENQLVRDTGLVSSLEFKVPLFRDEAGHGPVKLVPFFDYGVAKSKHGDTPEPTSIYSLGIGLQWEPNRHLHTELYWAESFKDIENTGEHDLQDSGIHFSVAYSVF